MTAYQTIAATLGLSLEELADNSYTATLAELEHIRTAGRPTVIPGPNGARHIDAGDHTLCGLPLDGQAFRSPAAEARRVSCGRCLDAAMTARAEHAPHMAVPLGVVPRRGGRGTVAAAHPARIRVGGGMFTGRASVSPMARPAAPAPVSSAGAGAQIGPAGTRIPSPRNPRPGHHGGTA